MPLQIPIGREDKLRGMVDLVLHRKDITSTLGSMLGLLMAPTRTRKARATSSEEIAAAK